MRDPRAMPVSYESERAMLACLLIDSSAVHQVHLDLQDDAFMQPLHRSVWAAIKALAPAGKHFDVIGVFTELMAMGVQVDMADLDEIAVYVPNSHNVRKYAQVVEDRYRARLLVHAGAEIAELARGAEGTAAEKIDKAQMLLAKMATVKARRDPESIDESLVNYLQLLQDLSDGKNPAIRTGLGGLDKILNGGMRRGEVMVIGARPKHGKTALALTMARNMARDHTVLYLSQEMPVSQLMHRHTAAVGSFDIGRILAADPNDSDMWSAVTHAARGLGELRLHHDDQCSLTLMDIRRKVLKVRRQHGLDVLFVDFLQLMAGAGEESRNRELDVIVNGIKALALDLELAVVVLSQMSRKADEHYSRPTMSYLRDSGAIEAAADQIALLFTDWAHPMSKRKPEFQGYSELEVVAHRNGPQGLAPLEFVGKYQQMGDWMRDTPTHKAEAPARAPSRAANF